MAKRQYNNTYPSVTSILDVLRKIGLEFWFKANTLQFIKKKSAEGKLIGTQIHQAIQSFIETGEAKIETQYADEVSIALKSFMLFRKENPDIVLKKSEIPLTSEKHQFNGTLDVLAEKNGMLIVADWKTSEAKKEDKPKIYDEYKTQISAYVNLYNEVNSSTINNAVIVVLAKDKVAYNLYEMEKQEIDDCFFEVFLPALKIKKYQMRKEIKNG